MKVTKKVAGVEYAIRDIVVAAKKLEQQGKKIEYLNIGDPVKYGFQPPDNVKEALINAVRNGENYYSESEGLPELRTAIAEKEHAKGLSVAGDDILVTNGISEGLDMVISSIVEEGDEVLLPGPPVEPRFPGDVAEGVGGIGVEDQGGDAGGVRRDVAELRGARAVGVHEEADREVGQALVTVGVTE